MCMMPHSGGEEEKKGVCAWHTSTAQWLAGNQRDSSMNKQGAYLPLPPSFFISMDMQWQHKSHLLTC